MDRQPGFAVVDLETTGFSNTDRIVEIGVVLLRPDLTVERTWETLIQPGCDIPNSYIHKITATDVVDAPAFREVAAYLGSLLNDRILVAHNAAFERRFLTNEFARAGAEDGMREWLDTMRLTKQHLGVGRLSEALTIAGIHNRLAHSALADAQATADLLSYLHTNYRAVIANVPPALFTTPAAEVQVLPRGGAASWAGQLSRTLPTTGTKDEAAYRAELTRALIDRTISRTEIRQLEHTAIAAGLSADDVDAINEEFTRQLAVEAWSDGVISDDERTTLLNIAQALGVEPVLVRSLLDDPVTGPTPSNFTLRPGDRIALTGAMDIPQEEWAYRATAAGLDVGDVTKKCALLVAANPDSMSGKAQKARKYDIPIVGETTFAQLLSAIDHNSVTEESSEQVEDNTEYEAPEQFSWLSPEHVRTTGTSTSRIAAAWIALHPTKPLHEMADNLQPHHVPEVTGRGIDRYLAVWSLEHPEMLHASADDLLDLPGVGPKRRSQLVEMVVDLAADGVPDDVAATEPAFTQPSPNPVAAPRPVADPPAQAPTAPTPEELLAAANAPHYTPAPVQSSWHAPAPAEPAPVPVKRPNAAKVFKWSAGLGVACFFLFGLCIETFDPDAESFIAGVFVMGVLLSGLTAAISGVMALINLIRGK
ncbi:exonuclease domain-containing protein [Corynebacterium lujinxingii]|uniref:3'-5' exoribonuclease n=1 Tax=Corynebacterium lujinxingii TaxID=2763010 RepID=A0A7H0JZL4_9CORY|nr:exonuclease domain-containing protein [Corynebacterium lujinxingii]MBC3179656.1 3'-5' exoribonuclease [Corynebacterium lujinxingii]NNO10348.1 hypothetical protein [Corynebacterium lujinxingii]QNP90480.1 3'-5' exoribonuclease [Corynebacterium lujinxingii]